MLRRATFTESTVWNLQNTIISGAYTIYIWKWGLHKVQCTLCAAVVSKPVHKSFPCLTGHLPLNLDEAHLLLLQQALNPLYID